MKNLFISKKIFIFAFLAIFILNCQQQKDDSKHPLFLKALNAREKANYLEAEKYLEQFLKQNPSSFKANLELALLCHNNLNNYIKALYHYNLALSLSSNSSDTEYIKTLILNAEIKLYNQLSEKYSPNLNNKIIHLEDENNMLKAQILALKQELNTLKKAHFSQTNTTQNQPLPISNQIPSEISQSSPPLIPSTYIVEPGDTLLKISKKIYGNSKYYRLIFNANKELLQREDAPLMIGQKLVIPPISLQEKN